MKRIFILSHDLSHNCLGRAVVLAKALERSYEVEIVGPCFGPDIWFPCRDAGITYRKVEGEIFLPQFTSLFARLLDKLKGDAVIAVKPRPTSFGVALMHRALTRRPILLDIDDDEMAFYDGDDWRQWERKVLLRRPNSPLYTAMLESAIPTADRISVATRALQDRYGGVYLPHVKDPAALDPARFKPDEIRSRRGFEPGEKLVVFAGSPRLHKGLDVLLEALNILGRDDVKLVVIGASNDPEDSLEIDLRRRGGERLHLLKQVPMAELPEALAMADLVALPQSAAPAARAQTPSKLFDAMSMALPIVASDVSDIREVLDDGSAGMLVPPGDAGALAAAIGEILESPGRARAMGDRARARLIERYSIDAARPAIEELIEGLPRRVRDREKKKRSAGARRR